MDAAGDRLYFISDLTGSPQLWSVRIDQAQAWPEPVAVNLDRVLFATPSSKPGRLVFGADVGGNERLQLYLVDGPGRAPRALTDSPTTMHSFGGWSPDGTSIAFSSNERDARFFDDVLVHLDGGADSEDREIECAAPAQLPISALEARWNPDRGQDLGERRLQLAMRQGVQRHNRARRFAIWSDERALQPRDPFLAIEVQRLVHE